MKVAEKIRNKKNNKSNEKRVIIEVIVLSGCSQCIPAAEMAYRVASQYNNVDVTLVNVTTPEGELKAKSLGIMTVPAIAINGKLTFIGNIQADMIMHDAVRKAM
ncbi:MAG TPA: thioredoxin family protein [Methanofastidiosum sp.]|nr:thioredoxin family protein [Methanofastidiosum sp.]HQF90384.1 thioredoxin family protein [Methanofastidiosum sp.]HQG61966.1 thioredoxin family protein [Methanofastidiosum sp.]